MKTLKSKVPGMTDVYTTRREAEARARELGGSGSHAHTFDGREVYMPFDNHEQYEEAIESSKYHHDEEDKKQMSARLEKHLKKRLMTTMNLLVTLQVKELL